jgi:phage-related protein
LQFLRELPAKDRAKIGWVLNWVEKTPMVHDKFLKKLKGTENLWEVRVDWAGNTYRILGFFHKEKLVLVHAFAKKTQSVPIREIEVANQRKKRYYSKVGFLS